MWWRCQEDTMVTKQTATRGSEHFLLLTRPLPEGLLWVFPRELGPHFLLFLFCFQGKKQPSPRCGSHYWHDWGPVCADAAGCPGYLSQGRWHSQMLRPQVDASPRGMWTPHPPISGLDLEDLPTSPQIFSLSSFSSCLTWY